MNHKHGRHQGNMPDSCHVTHVSSIEHHHRVLPLTIIVTEHQTEISVCFIVILRLQNYENYN